MEWVGPQEMSLEAQLFLLPEPEPSFHQDHSLAMLQGALCWEGLPGPCPVAIHSRTNIRKSWDIFILSGLSNCQSRKDSWGC